MKEVEVKEVEKEVEEAVEQALEDANETEVVIGIPGKWADQRELSRALNLAMIENGGYTFMGPFLGNVKTESVFEVYMEGHDENMKEAFKCAATSKFEDSLFEEIGEHTATVYIISKKVGQDVARELVHAVSDILKAGGLAVKIETTGVAHTKETWLKMQAEIKNPENEVPQLHGHFLTLTNYGDFFYTFGMKTFGLPDVAVPSKVLGDEASHVLQNLSFYLLNQHPEIHSGETYSAGIEAPFYVMEIKEDERYEKEDSFHNPFGIIFTEPMDKKAEKKKRKFWKKFTGR